MFTDLVRKNRLNVAAEPKNIVRLTKNHSYKEGISILIQTFEKSQYIWHILSKWSHVWMPPKFDFDVIIFKEFENGEILTEQYSKFGISSNLHNDPIDHKYLVRIYIRPADLPGTGTGNKAKSLVLVSSVLTTGDGPNLKKSFFEIVDNYLKYYNIKLEITLDNFLYSVQDTKCCSSKPEVALSKPIKNDTDDEKYYKLLRLRHSSETDDKVKRYWRFLTSSEEKKAKFIEYLKDEETKYFKYFDNTIPYYLSLPK